MDGCVELIEEEGEGLLALQRCSREQVTVAQAELNLENIGGFSQCRNIIFWIALLVEWAMKTLLKMITIYLNINPIRLSSLNEGRPQPVVHIWVANITNNVAPPVDPLIKVRETFLNPACNAKRVIQRSFIY